jgi:hypothetical protein
MNAKNNGIEEIIWWVFLGLQIIIYLFYTPLQSLPNASLIYLVASILSYPLACFLLAYCFKGRFKNRNQQSKKGLIALLVTALIFGILMEGFLWLLLFALHVVVLILFGVTLIWSAIKLFIYKTAEGENTTGLAS